MKIAPKTTALSAAIVLIFSVSGFTAAAEDTAWQIGETREIEMGVYRTFENVLDGWEIWKTETSRGVTCRVQKGPVPASDDRRPRVGDDMERPVMRFNKVSSGMDQRTGLQVLGNYGYSRNTAYRPEGEKFVTLHTFGHIAEPKHLLTLFGYDGKLVEVSARTCEYEEIGVGCREARGFIDFTGIKKAFSAVSECEAKDADKG